VVKHYRRIAVHEHVTSDVELFVVQQQRSHVVLNQTVVFQLRVLAFLLLFSFQVFLCARVQLWFVVNQVVQRKFSQVKLL
jgi:hypothetical protein